jgi:putative sterol carrier protein
MELADFARLVGGDLEPMRAVMEGRMRIEGDLTVAARLGEMFGQASGV